VAYTAVKLADVQKAIAAVTAANKKYTDAQASSKTSQTAVTNAQKALDAAQAKLDKLQAAFNDGSFLSNNTAYQNALKAIAPAEAAREKAYKSMFDNDYKKAKAGEVAYGKAIAAVDKAYAALDTARANAEKAYQNNTIKPAQTAFDTANKTFETAQTKYQNLVNSFQPLLDQRNEAIGNVSSYIDTIRGSLSDVTKFADAKQVQTLLGQIQTAVKGTKLDDLINPVTSMISQIDPLKMAAIPKVNIQGANPDVFSNIDPNTGLPVLDQGGLDAVLDRYKSNKIDTQQYRDNWNKFGWNVKSDASTAMRGPAVVGLDMGNIQQGMSGSTRGIVKAGTNQAATDTDFKKAAEQLGIDVNQYYVGKKLDQQSLYNDISDRTKDFYMVANSIDGDKHAALLFRADGSGNLVPVTNAQGAPMANYYTATRNVTGETWYGGLLPIAAIAASFALPGLSSALAGQIATATGLSATGGALVAANAALGAGMSALTGGDPIKGAIMAGAGTYATQNPGQITKALNISDAAINNIASVVKLDPSEVKTIIANGVSTTLAGGVTGSKNLAQDVIANVAGNFASAQAKQAVADNLKNLDPKQLAAASDIASNVANVAGNALVGGQNLTQALNAAAPGILSSGISAAGNIVSTTTGAAGFPLQTADQDQYEMQLVAAGFSPEQASTYAKAVFTPGMKGFDLGKIASIEDIPVSGGAIYAERENELKAPLPQNRRLATYEEAVKYDLTGIPLENGQYAFVMPVDVQQPDYSTIAGQAQAGAPGSMYGSTAIKENLPTGGSPFTGSFLPYYYSKSGSPLGISSAGKAIPMFSDLSGKLSPLQVNVEGGQKPLQIDVEGGQRLPSDVQDEYVKASQQFPLTEQEAAIEDPAQKEAALQQYQQYLQRIKTQQQQKTQELIDPKSIYYLTPEEQAAREYFMPSKIFESVTPFRRGGLASMNRNAKWRR
jgi:YD repeat-containing protein